MSIFKSKKTIPPKTIENFTLKLLLGNDKLIIINSCDRTILAAHSICMSHIVFMCLCGIPKQTSHKTTSFSQEQNRSLWRKMHCRDDTLLWIKEWPQSFTPPLALVPNNHFWLVIQEPAETDPHSELLRNHRNPSRHKKKCQKCKKNAEHITSSQEGYRKRSPNSLTSKHNWKR